MSMNALFSLSECKLKLFDKKQITPGKNHLGTETGGWKDTAQSVKCFATQA